MTAARRGVAGLALLSYLASKRSYERLDQELITTSGTVFHAPWWLDAVTDGRYGLVEAHQGSLHGFLPFMVEREYGLPVLRMPPLSFVSGPVLIAENGQKPSEHQQLSTVQQLLAELPTVCHASFRLHAGFSTTLAFDGNGFRNTAEFTADIAPAATDVLWKNMKDKTRNVLRRAAERFTVRQDLDQHDFLAFIEANLRDRGRVPAFPRPVGLRAIGESLRRGTGRVIGAEGADGMLHAAIFTVWDRRREYYLLSSRRQESGNGAVSLALWTALQDASAAGRVFDLAGVHGLPGLPNLNLLLGFGGVLRPRFVVSRTMRWLEALRPLAGSRRR